MTTPEARLGVRTDLIGVTPYTSPQQSARYRMNTNESPYAPPERMVDEIVEEIKEVALNRYPDRDAGELYDLLSQHLEWPRSGLWIANGSNEVLMHLFLAFGGPGRTSLTFEPSYSLHTLIPSIAGTATVQTMRTHDLSFDVEAAVGVVREQQPDIIIVCSPNNPTGDVTPRSAVRALLEESPGLVIVDEAYGDFAGDDASARSLIKDHPNLVITKTFSKAWRLAGVRIGYLMAHEDVISDLMRVRLPYHLSVPTQVVGRAALRHAGETLRFVHAICEERDRIAIELQALGLKTYPSQANFVLFEVDDPEETWGELIHRDILVRAYPSVPRLEHCLRVTAGLAEETEAFIGAMREIA
ncbi:MAG: histidinol-phosphate aminotransferase [Actinomycetota bacterium]|nr:histidinol-phosphate aminotransferase [Actinomycetota bacterium]